MEQISFKKVNRKVWANSPYFFGSHVILKKNTKTRFISTMTDKYILVMTGVLVVEVIIDKKKVRYALEEGDSWKVDFKLSCSYEAIEDTSFIEIIERKEWEEINN